jgi:hypothetical protein
MTNEQAPEPLTKPAPFVVMVYSPKLRGAAKKYSAHYRGVRVVETTDGKRPVSVNAKTVVRVVQEWGAVNIGRTLKSEGQRALAEANELVAKLNAGESV